MSSPPAAADRTSHHLEAAYGKPPQSVVSPPLASRVPDSPLSWQAFEASAPSLAVL